MGQARQAQGPVRVEEGPYGPRFAVDSDESLTTEDVRRILELTRR